MTVVFAAAAPILAAQPTAPGEALSEPIKILARTTKGLPACGTPTPDTANRAAAGGGGGGGGGAVVVVGGGVLPIWSW